MSNKTQLSNNNTKLASLIQELQGKAAGGDGASVETCTFTVNGGYIMLATVLNDGVIESAFHSVGIVSTLDNVVCGTVVYCRTTSDYTCSNCEKVLELPGASNCNFFRIYDGVSTAGITVDTSGDLPEPI